MLPEAEAVLADAQRFLEVLAQGGAFSFQVFDDTPAKRQRLAKILHGTFADHREALQRLNAQGAGVFVMINQGDGRGRKALNVKGVRALFVDLDGAPLEPVLQAPISPHIVVESSPGRWHAYWLVDNVPLDSFSHLQVQLAKMFNADLSIKDVCRVMRVPGFLHQKGERCRSRLITINETPNIPHQTFVETFGICPLIPVGERNERLFNAATSFKHAGIPKASAEARIAKVNASSTVTPLLASELAAIVDNAYSYATDGFSMIPHAIIDTAEFDNLSAAAAKLFFYAMRRHRPSKEFALPHSEFKHIVGLKNRQQFRAAVEELISVGLLMMTRNYVAGVAAEERRCALFRIADRVLNIPAYKGKFRIQNVPQCIGV